MEMDETEEHLRFLTLALNAAKKCTPTATAFCVGCVIAVTSQSQKVVLSTGYSRELPGNTHAEANALFKARALQASDLPELSSTNVDVLIASSDVYTTMEPCSVRTSGLSPCADALIAANIKRCFIGVGEPDDFVKCEGAEKLKRAGIEVVWLKGMEVECLEVARRGHEQTATTS